MSVPLLNFSENGLADAYQKAFSAVGTGKDISQRQLLDQARGLASTITGLGGYCINLCDSRFQFTLGFSATLLAGMTNLLPANRQPQTILQITTQYPESLILHDSALEETLVNKLQSKGTSLLDLASYAPGLTIRDDCREEIARGHHAAIVFTSGSTGQPASIIKTWGTLTGTTKLLCDRFLPRGTRTSIVATVPPQHMYGLEMTVMMALHGDCYIHSGRPFYPADIVKALEKMPAPRLLVTTPIHMKALLQSELALPKLHSVISATAPLESSMARQAEDSWSCPVKEIYGCSEAGSLASRRTTDGDKWHTLDSVALELINGEAVVSAPHLVEPVALQDRLEIKAPTQFHFLSRGADMLNVGGKRASLHQLTAQLLSVDGVSDGIVFLRDENMHGGHRERLAALVVSERPQQSIKRDLLQQIDPVFLPRPLKKVKALPRNTIGKCTRQGLMEALEKNDPSELGSGQ
jgi:acyl-coenzyme A synthetase/AMP-(fatty) acid ligase